LHSKQRLVDEGKKRGRSPQPAMATGLSEARRAGTPLEAPALGKAQRGNSP